MRQEALQEVCREFTRSIVERDDYATSMLQRLEKEKRDKIVKKMVATDAESIFRAIENENPLTKS